MSEARRRHPMAWGDKKAGFHYDAKKKTAWFNVVVPVTFKRRKRTMKGVSRVKAEEAFSKFRAGIIGHADGETHDGMTLAAYWKGPFAEKAVCVQPKTWAFYTFVVERFFLRDIGGVTFGNFALRDITDLPIQTFAARLEKVAEVSPATVNHALTMLVIIMRHAKKNRVIREMPFEEIKRHKLELLHQELNDEERLALYDHADPFYRPLFVIAVETGLRISDLLALTWEDVSKPDGIIRIQMLKTKKKTCIPITRQCGAALKELKGRNVIGIRVFVGVKTDRIPYLSVRRAFERAKRRAKITRPCRIHDLRHTTGRRLCDNGATTKEVADWLGHARTQTTERYMSVSESRLVALAKGM
jgi:integrase